MQALHNTVFNQTLDPLPHAQQIELIRRWQQTHDEAARDLLLRSNLRFVVEEARKLNTRKLSMDELTHEGLVGMLSAIDRFNPEAGFKFITYAVWWIRQRMRQALNEDELVPQPMNSLRAVRTVNALRRKTEQVRGRLVSDEEIYELAEEQFATTPTQRHMLGGLRDANVVTVSLDAPMDGDYGERNSASRYEHSEIASVMASDGELEAQEQKALFARSITHLLKKLNSRERFVIEHYHGINGCEPHTLEQVGQLCGFTRERARQVKEDAFTKMQREHDANPFQEGVVRAAITKAAAESTP